MFSHLYEYRCSCRVDGVNVRAILDGRQLHVMIPFDASKEGAAADEAQHARRVEYFMHVINSNVAERLGARTLQDNIDDLWTQIIHQRECKILQRTIAYDS